MAKRTRGTSRPGQRAPIQRTTRPAGGASGAISQPVAPSPASPVQIPAEGLDGGLPAAPNEAAAGAAGATLAPSPASSGARGAASSSRTAAPVSLAAVTETEYRYVTRDLRRIGLIGGSMFGLLGIAFVALEVIGVGR
jgi:hypothetical protein